MIFKGKMFRVWEGNHRVTSWRHHNDQYHDIEIDWHFSVDYICLDPIGGIGILLDAMNNINGLYF